MKEYFINGSGGGTIACYAHSSHQTYINGIVYFAHSVTEYAERYCDLFNMLAHNGYDVITNDHMGHGNSTDNGRKPRRQRRIWDCMCRDAKVAIEKGKEVLGRPRNTPVYAIGFSVGTYIIKAMAMKHPKLFTSAVLIGSGDMPNIKGKILEFIMQYEIKKHGADKATDLTRQIALESYNRNYAIDDYDRDECEFTDEEKLRNDFEWLCANQATVDSYIHDKMCNPVLTAGLVSELIRGMRETGKQKNIQKINPSTSWMLVSGTDDAFGGYTKDVNSFANKLTKAKIYNEVVFFDGMRHDILHEVGSCSVNDAILRFLSGATVEDDVKVYEPEHKHKSVPADIDMQLTQRISPVVAAIADEIEAAVAKETV